MVVGNVPSSGAGLTEVLSFYGGLAMLFLYLTITTDSI